MFNWFKKQKQEVAEQPLEHEDLIEETLWEIKEEFDLKTEEVERAVIDKRENIEYMRKRLKRDL
jgi:hypothetical protein